MNSSGRTILNNSTDDVNKLSTFRDVKYLQVGENMPQFEPGVVLDIILDDKHPLFANGEMGNITIPSEYPKNYNNLPASSSDKSYYPIGTVLVRLCYTQQKVEKENLIWAIPIDSSFTTYPVLNEVVNVVYILDKFYYTNKINTKNNNNTSADFRYEQTYGKKISNRSYSGSTTVVELRGPESRLDSTNDRFYSGFRGILGNYFWFNDKIRNLKHYEGDSIFESRFGQSIRMGAYDDNRKNDKGVYDNYKSDKEEVGGGNPMILIRNRQRPIAKDNTQQLHPLLNKIDDVNSSPNEKNVGGYLIEDINNDGSSIHITSGLTVSRFKTTCYKKYFSTNSGEEQVKFNPPNATTFKMPELSGDQIVIHSDRLIFASRFGETLHFSKKRYMVTTDSEYTVDAHNQIVFTTNTKTVFNSPAIYLGEHNNTNEPAVLGQTLADWLYDLCLWLEEHTHWHEHTHEDVGVPTPKNTQVPVQIRQLRSLRDKIHTIMSRRVFLTGGGYAPGGDGGEIVDGVPSTKINTFSGTGVPGGWPASNRRESPRKF